jgi:hypothetical protein
VFNVVAYRDKKVVGVFVRVFVRRFTVDAGSIPAGALEGSESSQRLI